MSDISNRSFHEVANIFPMLEGAEFKALCDDIRERGLLERIWRHDGQIIDGRNRYLACKEVGIEPRFQEWSGDGDLEDFVIALNVKRRHLTLDQRCKIALRILPRYQEEAKRRQLAMLNPVTRPGGERSVPEDQYGEAADCAAATVGISGDTLKRYQLIAQHPIPELIDLVEQGKLGIRDAALLVNRYCVQRGTVGQADLQRALQVGDAQSAKQLVQSVRDEMKDARRDRDTEPEGPALAGTPTELVYSQSSMARTDGPNGDVHCNGTAGHHNKANVEADKKQAKPEENDDAPSQGPPILAIHDYASDGPVGPDHDPADDIQQAGAEWRRLVEVQEFLASIPQQGGLENLTRDWTWRLRSSIVVALRGLSADAIRCADDLERLIEWHDLDKATQPLASGVTSA